MLYIFSNLVTCKKHRNYNAFQSTFTTKERKKEFKKEKKELLRAESKREEKIPNELVQVVTAVSNVPKKRFIMPMLFSSTPKYIMYVCLNRQKGSFPIIITNRQKGSEKQRKIWKKCTFINKANKLQVLTKKPDKMYLHHFKKHPSQRRRNSVSSNFSTNQKNYSEVSPPLTHLTYYNLISSRLSDKSKKTV